MTKACPRLRATLPFGSAVTPKSRLARYVFRPDFFRARMTVQHPIFERYAISGLLNLLIIVRSSAASELERLLRAKRIWNNCTGLTLLRQAAPCAAFDAEVPPCWVGPLHF